MSILQKNKKLAAGIGVAAVAAAALALGAGTYAAFSDTETGPGGTLAAGSLDLEVGGSPNQSTLLNISNIRPGQNLAPVTLTVTNSGTLNGNLSGFLTIAGSDGTSCTEPERLAEALATCATNGNLQDQLKVTVNGPGIPAVGQVLSLPLTNNQAFPGGSVPAGQTVTYTLDFSLPDLPGTDNNRVQSDTLTISSTLNLVQS